jgi:FAD/FMN-containing dehydrogenase
VTPQGGNTGLVGGSVPTVPDSVVVSTTRLRRLDEVDATARRVAAGAGVTITALQQHASRAGLAYGVDLASRDSATLGGTIATNAGGVRVVLHGDTRAQVVGVEAVLAEGQVMSHLSGLAKDSAGFDVGRLLVGAEGTLGIVTAATVRLHTPLPAERMTALVGVEQVADALALLQQDGLLAAEFVAGSAMDLVCDVNQLPFPLARRWPLYVLVETAAEPHLSAGVDCAVDRRLWSYREQVPEAISTLGPHVALDVAVPLGVLQKVLDELPELAAPHTTHLFGHLAEGNLHIHVVGDKSSAPFDPAVVLKFIAELGGSISSEHGIGVAKREFLGLARDDTEIAAMRRIKTALDPECLLNPGVLLP